ncbi:MAG: alpha/beta hydrolase family protein [Alphaproteobacteria bacterium]
MAYRLGARLSAIFLICTVILCGPAQAAPPAEAFGSLPTFGDAEISPDGRRIAMLQTFKGRTVATIYKVGAPQGTRPVIINPGQGKVRSIRWATNDRLLIWMSITHKMGGGRQAETYEVRRILSMKADGSDSAFLFRDSDFQYVLNAPFLLSSLPDDPNHILMFQIDAERYERGGVKKGSNIPRSGFRGLSVYRVNVNDGRAEKVESAWKTTGKWLVDSNATVRVRIDEDHRMTILARGPQGGDFKQIAQYDDEDPRSGMSFRGFGTDPNTVYVTARRDTDRLGVYTYDLSAAKVSGKAFLHDRFDVDGVIRDWHTDRIVGATYTAHMPEATYWDPAWAALQKRLEGVFKGRTVSIVSVSRDRNAVIFLVETPGNPGTYYLYEANAKRVSPLGPRYEGLAEKDLGTVKPLTYEARDGLTIPAYLTLPPGKEAKDLPLVVLPHGGPAARDDQSFHWWASFYASRGYAVLQPNYRGSEGYGKKFVEAGYGEFGGKMQDDLTDGVKHLVAQDIADPERVCIVGGSYGGYAALAGAAFTTDVYACAVSVNGVSDLVLMMGEAVRRRDVQVGFYSVDYWQKWLGDRYRAQDQMKAASPALHADRVGAPVLLIHGKDDTVVPFLHSEKMANALREAGKPHKLIELEGEDHGLSRADSRIRVLKETESFLKEHIGG